MRRQICIMASAALLALCGVLGSADAGRKTWYYTSKNKQKQPGRLEIKKYDPVVRKHVVYKESR